MHQFRRLESLTTPSNIPWRESSADHLSIGGKNPLYQVSPPYQTQAVVMPRQNNSGSKKSRAASRQRVTEQELQYVPSHLYLPLAQVLERPRVLKTPSSTSVNLKHHPQSRQGKGGREQRPEEMATMSHWQLQPLSSPHKCSTRRGLQALADMPGGVVSQKSIIQTLAHTGGKVQHLQSLKKQRRNRKRQQRLLLQGDNGAARSSDHKNVQDKSDDNEDESQQSPDSKKGPSPTLRQFKGVFQANNQEDIGQQVHQLESMATLLKKLEKTVAVNFKGSFSCDAPNQKSNQKSDASTSPQPQPLTPKKHEGCNGSSTKGLIEQRFPNLNQAVSREKLTTPLKKKKQQYMKVKQQSQQAIVVQKTIKRDVSLPLMNGTRGLNSGNNTPFQRLLGDGELNAGDIKVPPKYHTATPGDSKKSLLQSSSMNLVVKDDQVSAATTFPIKKPLANVGGTGPKKSTLQSKLVSPKSKPLVEEVSEVWVPQGPATNKHSTISHHDSPYNTQQPATTKVQKKKTTVTVKKVKSTKQSEIEITEQRKQEPDPEQQQQVNDLNEGEKETLLEFTRSLESADVKSSAPKKGEEEDTPVPRQLSQEQKNQMSQNNMELYKKKVLNEKPTINLETKFILRSKPSAMQSSSNSPLNKSPPLNLEALKNTQCNVSKESPRFQASSPPPLLFQDHMKKSESQLTKYQVDHQTSMKLRNQSKTSIFENTHSQYYSQKIHQHSREVVKSQKLFGTGGGGGLGSMQSTTQILEDKKHANTSCLLSHLPSSISSPLTIDLIPRPQPISTSVSYSTTSFQQMKNSLGLIQPPNLSPVFQIQQQQQQKLQQQQQLQQERKSQALQSFKQQQLLHRAINAETGSQNSLTASSQCPIPAASSLNKKLLPLIEETEVVPKRPLVILKKSSKVVGSQPDQQSPKHLSEGGNNQSASDVFNFIKRSSQTKLPTNIEGKSSPQLSMTNIKSEFVKAIEAQQDLQQQNQRKLSLGGRKSQLEGLGVVNPSTHLQEDKPIPASTPLYYNFGIQKPVVVGQAIFAQTAQKPQPQSGVQNKNGTQQQAQFSQTQSKFTPQKQRGKEGSSVTLTPLKKPPPGGFKKRTKPADQDKDGTDDEKQKDENYKVPATETVNEKQISLLSKHKNNGLGSGSASTASILKTSAGGKREMLRNNSLSPIKGSFGGPSGQEQNRQKSSMSPAKARGLYKNRRKADEASDEEDDAKALQPVERVRPALFVMLERQLLEAKEGKRTAEGERPKPITIKIQHNENQKERAALRDTRISKAIDLSNHLLRLANKSQLPPSQIYNLTPQQFFTQSDIKCLRKANIVIPKTKDLGAFLKSRDFYAQAREAASIILSSELQVSSSFPGTKMTHEIGQGGVPGFYSKFFVGYGNNYPLVKQILKLRWWLAPGESVSFEECNIVWTSWKKQKIVNKLPIYQDYLSSYAPYRAGERATQRGGNKVVVKKLYGRMEDNFHLANKKGLLLNLKEYYRLQSKCVFNEKVFPQTFLLKSNESQSSDEFRNLKQYISDNPEAKWIVKPGENSNRGAGIILCDNSNDLFALIRTVNQGDSKTLIEHNCELDSSRSMQQHQKQANSHTLIVQSYIKNPLLINKRKFDIRVYGMLVTHYGTMRGYFFEDGYLRTSSKEFTLENFNNKYIHLTNDAIQKFSEDYGKFENANKLSYPDFQKYLESQEFLSSTKYKTPGSIKFMRDLLPQIRHLVTESFKSVAYKRIDPNRRVNSFEIFGFDFMIDEDFVVYLIEANTNPCLEINGCPVLARIIPNMLDCAFRIAVDPLLPPPDWSFKKGLEPISENKFSLIYDDTIDLEDIQYLYDKDKTSASRRDSNLNDLIEDEKNLEELRENEDLEEDCLCQE